MKKLREHQMNDEETLKMLAKQNAQYLDGLSNSMKEIDDPEKGLAFLIYSYIDIAASSFVLALMLERQGNDFSFEKLKSYEAFTHLVKTHLEGVEQYKEIADLVRSVIKQGDL